MKISSTSFSEGAEIPRKFGAEEGNVVPHLSWSDAPEGTKSFALTIYDPDAPTGSGFWHWIVTDIPVTVTSVEEGSSIEAGIEWVNDYGSVGYGGPNPPAGRSHRYVHTIHAMPDETLDLPEDLSQAQVRFNIYTRQLGEASITGTFAN